MWSQKPSFRFEIDNFSQHMKTKRNLSRKKPIIRSEIFESGGCQWFLDVCPKGYYCNDHVSLFLHLKSGLKRDARYYSVVLNQSEEELFRSSVSPRNLCTERQGWGISHALPHSEIREKGVLVNDRLIVEVYINVFETDVGEGGDVSEKEEIVDIKGFEVFASQADSVKKIFAEHPEFAKDFKPKNKVVKTEYMNVLLNLIKALEKPQKSFSKTKRKKARRDLTELIDAGFKLDWLMSMLELEVSLERKKACDPDVSQVQQPKEMSLPVKKENADWSRVQKLEESVKNLELSGVCRNYLNERLKDVSVERRESHEAVESQVKQLEKSVKNLELMVSNLTAELDKEKANSSVDEFFMVNNVD